MTFLLKVLELQPAKSWEGPLSLLTLFPPKHYYWPLLEAGCWAKPDLWLEISGLNPMLQAQESSARCAVLGSPIFWCPSPKAFPLSPSSWGLPPGCEGTAISSTCWSHKTDKDLLPIGELHSIKHVPVKWTQLCYVFLDWVRCGQPVLLPTLNNRIYLLLFCGLVLKTSLELSYTRRAPVPHLGGWAHLRCCASEFESHLRRCRVPERQ